MLKQKKKKICFKTKLWWKMVMGGKEYPKNLPSGFFMQSELYRAKEKTVENKMESKKKMRNILKTQILPPTY